MGAELVCYITKKEKYDKFLKAYEEEIKKDNDYDYDMLEKIVDSCMLFFVGRSSSLLTAYLNECREDYKVVDEKLISGMLSFLKREKRTLKKQLEYYKGNMDSYVDDEDYTKGIEYLNNSLDHNSEEYKYLKKLLDDFMKDRYLYEPIELKYLIQDINEVDYCIKLLESIKLILPDSSDDEIIYFCYSY